MLGSPGGCDAGRGGRRAAPSTSWTSSGARSSPRRSPVKRSRSGRRRCGCSSDVVNWEIGPDRRRWRARGRDGSLHGDRAGGASAADPPTPPSTARRAHHEPDTRDAALADGVARAAWDVLPSGSLRSTRASILTEARSSIPANGGILAERPSWLSHQRARAGSHLRTRARRCVRRRACPPV